MSWRCMIKKGRLVRIFQHCCRRLIVLLPPNEFLHSSPELPRTIQARETSASEGRNYQEFSQQIRNLGKYQVLLHAAKLGHGTDSFTSPPKEGLLRIIRKTEKSNGFGRVRTRELGYQRPACWPLDHRSRLTLHDSVWTFRWCKNCSSVLTVFRLMRLNVKE